jgi:hypothetical protein
MSCLEQMLSKKYETRFEQKYLREHCIPHIVSQRIGRKKEKYVTDKEKRRTFLLGQIYAADYFRTELVHNIALISLNVQLI